MSFLVNLIRSPGRANEKNVVLEELNNMMKDMISDAYQTCNRKLTELNSIVSEDVLRKYFIGTNEQFEMFLEQMRAPSQALKKYQDDIDRVLMLAATKPDSKKQRFKIKDDIKLRLKACSRPIESLTNNLVYQMQIDITNLQNIRRRNIIIICVLATLPLVISALLIVYFVRQKSEEQE